MLVIHAMNKRYYLPIICFLLASIIDVISINSYSEELSQQSLEKRIETILNAESVRIFEDKNLDLINAQSLNYDDLNKLKVFEDRLSEKDIKIELFKDDQLIYWSGIIPANPYCKTYEKDQLILEICVNNNIEYFNNQTSLSKRPVYIQRISIGLYFVTLLLFILIAINQTHVLPILALVFFRVILLFVPWRNLYPDLDITQSIFLLNNYCIMDLFMDAAIIFGLVSIFIKKQYLVSNDKNTRFFLHTGVFILVLGLISHIRLVQLLVNSDQVLNNLSDISQLNATDILGLSTLLVLLLAVFIYSNSLFYAFKKAALKKQHSYLSSFAAVVLALAISILIGLDLNIWILAAFLGSWILLFDLFTDVKQKNITWLIWWAIFLSVYLSSILFNYDIKKEIKLRSEFLAEAIYDAPDSNLIETIESKELVALDTILLNLLDVPEGIKLDKEDFLDYVHTLGPLRLDDIDILDGDLNSIFSNTKVNLSKSNLISIGSNVLFDQITNSALVSRYLNEDYRYSVLIKLSDDPVKEKYNFNYYWNGTLIHSEFKLNANAYEAIKTSKKNYVFMDSNVFVKWEDDSKLLVTRKSFESLIKPIALFSLIFVMVILFGFILSISNIWLKYLPTEWPFRIQRIDSLNSKIQASLILVILLSFVVIAFITNSFLNNFLNREKEKYYRNKIVTISNDLQYQTTIANTSEEMVAIASNFSNKISSIHDADIDIVAIDSLKRSIPYFNYVYFTKNQNQTAFTEENNGGAISYVPLKFNGNTVAYASINHRNSNSNEVKVFDFLGSIFNVYVFLFLIASVLAIFLARSITKPLALLNQKLGKLKLGKRNELIAWDRDDEIGNLITNYNNMVHQLEESAQVLAKTERDSAWREMAKQVAHEIKNPLTPMKLSIQYLEKAIKQNPPEAVQISKKISGTLLEQIDNLAEIANAFGNFAELPQSSNIKIEINEVVEMVHNLFRKREDMDITLAVPIDPIYVYGDKNQLIRILNNLVKNAVESVPQSRRGVIKLNLYTQNENAIIKVSDNGEGIALDMQDKIFQPKFTTKDSGSGLGLAISANMIESMNGRLYFESKPGVGTDFYIELDIIRPSNYQDQDKRITLD